SSVRLRASFIHRCRSGALFRWCWWGYSVSAASAVTPRLTCATVPKPQPPGSSRPLHLHPSHVVPHPAGGL
ncbi:Os12g0559000, partial [Oryza sativa Japonica Group]